MTKNIHNKIDCNSEYSENKGALLAGNLSLFIDLYESLEFVLDNKNQFAEWTNCSKAIIATEIVRDQLEQIIEEAVSLQAKN